MLLGALQDFEWYNEPENVIFRNRALHVAAAPKTDFWQSRHRNFEMDNGHFFFIRRENNFSFVLKWNFTASKPYDQCGIMLRIDEKNWIKASIMYDSPERPMLGSCVTQNGYSDWAAQDIPSGVDEIWFKLRRLNGDYLVSYSLDGDNFKQIRITHLQNDMPEVKVGAYICSPGEGGFEAVLSQIGFI